MGSDGTAIESAVEGKSIKAWGSGGTNVGGRRRDRPSQRGPHNAVLPSPANRYSISPARPRFLRALQFGGEEWRTAVQGRSGAHEGSEAAGFSAREQIIQGVGLGWYERRRTPAGRPSHRAPQCRTTPPGKGDRVGPLDSDYAAAPSKWQRTRAEHDEHVKPETGAADGAREA